MHGKLSRVRHGGGGFAETGGARGEGRGLCR